VSISFSSLAPVQGVGQTPLYISYNPTTLQNPSGPTDLTDTIGCLTLDPNKTTISVFRFKPKNSANPGVPAGSFSTEDADGFLPFSTSSVGFAQPYFGCVMTWQDQTTGYGEKCWSLAWTFHLSCTMNC